MWFLIGVLMVTVTAVAMGQTVTFSGAPTSGACPLNVTLTWSSSGCATLSKQDGWSGSAPLSGSTTIAINAATTWTLVCTAPTPSVTLSWTAPTQNENGTPLTDLAGYDVLHASTAGGVSAGTLVPLPIPSATSIILNGLPAGPRYFGLRAYNAQGTRSILSGLATMNIAGGTDTKSVTADCDSTPNPPTGVSVIATQAYEVGQWGGIGRYVGNVPLGTECGALVKIKNGYRFHEVPKALIVPRTSTTKLNAARYAAVCA